MCVYVLSVLVLTRAITLRVWLVFFCIFGARSFFRVRSVCARSDTHDQHVPVAHVDSQGQRPSGEGVGSGREKKEPAFCPFPGGFGVDD